MNITYNPAGGIIQILPHFAQSCWGFLTIELINDRFFSFRRLDLMSHDHVRTLDLPQNTFLTAQHFYGIDATFTLNSPDVVSASLQFSQDGVIIGTAMLPDTVANDGVSITLRVRCVAQ